jgi:hypothetical protein
MVGGQGTERLCGILISGRHLSGELYDGETSGRLLGKLSEVSVTGSNQNGAHWILRKNGRNSRSVGEYHRIPIAGGSAEI